MQAVVTRACRECGEVVDDAVAVALEHVASTARRVVFLCPLCTADLKIMRLTDPP
ncbi:hypothetical protein ABZ953_00235 [Streptomyces sp. NPDC046465]|uniref:hypothetical protein n=1 Tax=Streptomyces sp. NPDC046465 TaxID=3155810 RepID=UPI0033D35035